MKERASANESISVRVQALGIRRFCRLDARRVGWRQRWRCEAINGDRASLEMAEVATERLRLRDTDIGWPLEELPWLALHPEASRR